MSGAATLVAIGSVTVGATSTETLATFQSLAASINALPDANRVTYSGDGVPSVAAGETSALLVPASATGTISLPSVYWYSYKYVVVGANSSANIVDTAQQASTIIGTGLHYSGQAYGIFASGNSSVVASAVGANVHIDAGGTSSVLAADGYDVVRVGQGASAVVSVGFSDTIIAGAGSNTTISGYTGNHISIAGGATSTITLRPDTYNVGYNLGNVDIAPGATTMINADQSHVTFNIGFNPSAPPTVPPPSPTVPANAAGNRLAASSVTAFTNKIADTGTQNFFNITDAQSVNLIALGTNDAVNALAGASTVFGGTRDVISVGSAATLFFVGGSTTVQGAASTVYGGLSNVTLFATTGQQFNAGAASSNVFVGGSAESTVNGGSGGGSFFGGASGDLYSSGVGSSQVFVGLGGADTISSAAGTIAPIIYAENAERMVLTGAASTTLVAFTNGGTIDASRTTGTNVVFAGFGGSGNETLVGSTSNVDASGQSRSDIFVIGADPTPPPSTVTVTIDNWHGGDVFYLTGFQSIDVQTLDGAVSNSLAQGGVGDLTVTLSDKTTISFVGHHPTNFIGNAAF